MKRILTPVLLSSVFLLQACASRPEMTREQWLETTSHNYPNHTKEELISAAEEVLRLADKTDMRFAHNREGFMATRNWVVYMVLAATSGVDYWKIETREESEGASIDISVSTAYNTYAASPVVNGSGGNVTTLGMPGTPVDGNALYELFWERFDFILGLNDNWVQCSEEREFKKQRNLWGLTDPLCNGMSETDLIPQRALDLGEYREQKKSFNH
jgi:hypothetical protein